jgi:hypothetical protein
MRPQSVISPECTDHRQRKLDRQTRLLVPEVSVHPFASQPVAGVVRDGHTCDSGGGVDAGGAGLMVQLEPVGNVGKPTETDGHVSHLPIAFLRTASVVHLLARNLH